MPLADAFEQRLRHQRLLHEDAIEDVAELVVIRSQIENRRDFAYEIFSPDPAGLEAYHEIARPQPLRYLGRGIGTKTFHPCVGTLEIERHDDVAQVEDNGLDHSIRL